MQGVNDSGATVSEWQASGVVPTYISTTSFSLAGDQTSAFHKGRRAQFTTAGGTVYGKIINSVFTTLTTVTMLMDGTTVLDSGLSAVNLALLRADIQSLPNPIELLRSTVVGNATATPTWDRAYGEIQDVSGVVVYTAIPDAPRPGAKREWYPAAGATMTNGGSISVQGGASVTASAGDKWVINAVTVNTFYVEVFPKSTPPLLRGYKSGLKMSTAGASTTITIDPGVAADSANAVMISLPSAISKTTGAWAVGSGVGGLDTGTIRVSAFAATCSFATSVMTCTVAPTSGSFAVGQKIYAMGVAPGTTIASLGSGTGGTGTYNLSTTPGTLSARTTYGLTWYYQYLIRRPDTGVVDEVFSLSYPTPTLPASYTQYRYIEGSLVNGLGQWQKFIQTGDEIRWTTPFLDFNGGGAASGQSLAITVPPGTKVNAKFNLFAASGASGIASVYLSDPDADNLAPSSSVSPLASLTVAGAAGQTAACQASCITGALGQIRHYEENAEAIRIATLGWSSDGGRNA